MQEEKEQDEQEDQSGPWDKNITNPRGIGFSSADCHIHAMSHIAQSQSSHNVPAICFSSISRHAPSGLQ